MLTEMRDTVPMTLKSMGIDPDRASEDEWLSAVDKVVEGGGVRSDPQVHRQRVHQGPAEGRHLDSARLVRGRRAAPEGEPGHRVRDAEGGLHALVDEHGDPRRRAEPAGGAGVHRLRLRPRGSGRHRGVGELRDAGDRGQGDPAQARPRPREEPAHLPERGSTRRTAASSRCSAGSWARRSRRRSSRRSGRRCGRSRSPRSRPRRSRATPPRRCGGSASASERVRELAPRRAARDVPGAPPGRACRRRSSRTDTSSGPGRGRSRAAHRRARRDRPRDGALARARARSTSAARASACTTPASCFSPEGELVARYRKVFPWQPHETSAPGDALRHLRHPGRRPGRPLDLLRRQLSGDLPPARVDGGGGRAPAEPHHHERPLPGARDGARERDLQPALRRLA